MASTCERSASNSDSPAVHWFQGLRQLLYPSSRDTVPLPVPVPVSLPVFVVRSIARRGGGTAASDAQSYDVRLESKSGMSPHPELRMPEPRTLMHNRWRPLRELFARVLRALIGSVMAVAAWAGRQLDYARPFRPEAHYQQVRLASGFWFLPMGAPSASGAHYQQVQLHVSAFATAFSVPTIPCACWHCRQTSSTVWTTPCWRTERPAGPRRAERLEGG